MSPLASVSTWPIVVLLMVRATVLAPVPLVVPAPDIADELGVAPMPDPL